MDVEIAIEAESFIKKVLLITIPEMNKEAIQAVNHYINHAEYEMAFEGLFTEIMNLGTVPDIDWYKSIEIAKKLKLNEESVFDYNFWTRFSNYIDNKINNNIK